MTLQEALALSKGERPILRLGGRWSPNWAFVPRGCPCKRGTYWCVTSIAGDNIAVSPRCQRENDWVVLD
jgi:hypothetical protein